MQETAKTAGELYSDQFAALRKERQSEPAWMLERRAAAMQSFETQGFPTRRHEAWRNLNFAPVSASYFPPVRLAGDVDAELEALRRILPDAHWAVLIDGHFSAELSQLDGLPEGVTLSTLSDALQAENAALEAHLGQHAPTDKHVFAALNTALFEGGVLVHAAAEVELEQPLVIANLISPQATDRAVYPRALIVAEAGAQLQTVEFHRGDAGVYLNCPVTEIVVADGAKVNHHLVQENDKQAFHLGVIAGHLTEDAELSVHSFAVGGKIARTDIYGDLTGERGLAHFDGLYLLSEGQYIDHHTWMTHQAEHCESHQTFKGVLSGRSEAVFDGLVLVAEGAQKTDANQQNHHLLLTRRALVHSNPRLEIYADDVKCTHGSTIGELDDEALFYLRSRGIGPAEARNLLIYAFIGEVLEPVGIESLREYQRQVAMDYLPDNQTKQESS